MSNSWQYYALLRLSKFICFFSYTFISKTGKFVGQLCFHVLGRHRERAILHIQQGLACDYKKAEQISKEMFCNLGISIFEFMYSPRLNKENFEEFFTIENKEYLEDSLKKGKGIVLLTAHFGNWEWLAIALSLYGFPVTAIAKKQPNDQITRFLNHFREQQGIEIFHRGGSELVGALKALKKNKILGFLVDQDGGVNGIPVEFLGKMASHPTGPAFFASKFGAEVIPIFIIRTESKKQKIVVLESIPFEKTEDNAQDMFILTEKIVKMLEKMIKENPTQWLWAQHLWTTSEEDMVLLKKNMGEKNE